jgi:hypothetical protein
MPYTLIAHDDAYADGARMEYFVVALFLTNKSDLLVYTLYSGSQKLGRHSITANGSRGSQMKSAA